MPPRRSRSREKQFHYGLAPFYKSRPRSSPRHPHREGNRLGAPSPPPLPDEWRIHPSTEARGSGFQHERRVWGINDQEQWIILKVRHHAQDPARTAAGAGFEGGQVSLLNTGLSQLL
jgi:hypothetical protein